MPPPGKNVNSFQQAAEARLLSSTFAPASVAPNSLAWPWPSNWNLPFAIHPSTPAPM
jgi:hypothetical protein